VTILIEQFKGNLLHHEAPSIPHALIEEAYASTYPRAPFPGVSPERMDISRVGRAPHLPPDVEKFAVELTHAINLELTISAQSLVPGQSGEYMTMLKSPAETEEIISRAAQAVYTVAMRHPEIPIICPPAGATPLARLLAAQGIPEDRIHSPEIKGTVGTETGNAHITAGSLPRSIIETMSPKILFEDIPDSCSTTAALALELFKAKYPSRYDQAAAHEMRLRLKIANTNGHADREVYKLLAELCAEVDLVPVYVMSKNVRFSEALYRTSIKYAITHPAFSQTINEIFELHPVTEIPKYWVTGPADTGLTLSRIRERFHGTHLWKHPLFTHGIRSENNEWLLRLGQIPGLAYLNPALHHEEHIIELAAKKFAWMAERQGK